jgi:hypothetical protein
MVVLMGRFWGGKMTEEEATGEGRCDEYFEST